MQKPLYVLAAAPCEPSRLKGVFESGEGSVMEILKNPGQLRYAGWDLQTLNTPRIIKGECLEVKSGKRKLIRLYEDGTLIVRVPADQSFLGWGQDEDAFMKKPRLNPITIVEFTYNFVDFYKKLVPHFITKPTKIKFRVKLKNTLIETERIYLTPYGVGTVAWDFDDDRHYAPKEEMIENIDIEVDNLLRSPAHVAYQLVERLYLWFGLEPKEIPYASKDNEGNRFIDAEKIKKIK